MTFHGCEIKITFEQARSDARLFFFWHDFCIFYSEFVFDIIEDFGQLRSDARLPCFYEQKRRFCKIKMTKFCKNKQKITNFCKLFAYVKNIL